MININDLKILAERYKEEIRPILEARGRNFVPPVAQYIAMISDRLELPSIDTAEKILSKARCSKRYPLAFWASDIRVLYKGEAPAIVSKVVDYYRDRAKLTAEEKQELRVMLFESDNAKSL